MISCQEYRRILSEAVELRSELPMNAIEHGSHCDNLRCQKELEEFLILESAIQSWRQSLPSLDLTDAVVREIEPTVAEHSVVALRPRSLTSPHENIRGSQPVAICIAVLTLFVGLLALLTTGLPTHRQLADSTLHPPTQVVDGERTGMDEESLAREEELKKYGKAYGSLIHSAADKLTDTMTVVLLDEQDGQDTATPSWISNWSERLQPIESTLKDILDEAVEETDEQTSLPHRSEGILGILSIEIVIFESLV